MYRMELKFLPSRPSTLPLAVMCLLVFAATPAAPAQDEPGSGLVSDHLGAPMRVRDFTFPNILVLGFAPQPAASIGKGRYAIEMHGSLVNDFQASPAVEEYLESSRNGDRRPLDLTDANVIRNLPDGQAYYIDAEFAYYDFAFHYGLTERLDVSLGWSYYDLGRGELDGTIFDFHDSYGFSNQGREFVADDQFQVVLGFGDDDLVILQAPSSGAGDPNLSLRYAIPGPGRWDFNVAGTVKFPLASEDTLSSGSTDYGGLLTADWRGRRNAVMFNLSIVKAGNIDPLEFDPPILPALDVSWLHGFGQTRRLRSFFQVLMADHAFRDVVDSGLSEPEFQLTVGLKWQTRHLGVVGFGLTENLLNYDNTPDIGLHLSWGFLSGG
ncbi:MAG: DUF3187 family protein [Acidobacteriota bacterium]